jgi:hypothetical protein
MLGIGCEYVFSVVDIADWFIRDLPESRLRSQYRYPDVDCEK